MKIRRLLMLVTPILLAAGCSEAPESRLTGPTSLQSSHTCELEVPLADAVAEIAALRAEVDALEASGALNSGQANALRNHLDNAQRHLDAGRVCPALAQLRAFGEQVEDFVADEVLTDMEAGPLLEGAGRVLGDTPPAIVPESISAGTGFTCGLTETGTAYCWGENASGELGDGTTTDRLTPTPVGGGLTFASVSAGGSHACGLRADGTAYCWGRNSVGELGDGTTTDRLTPTPVSDGLTFASVSAGSSYTCGLVTDGSAYCWGFNANGELGDGTTTNRLSPSLVSGELTFTAISAGAGTTCSLVTNGAAYCWGANPFGELGTGTSGNRELVPTPVSGDIVFASLSSGFTHTCGLAVGGAAYCWGDNFFGGLGDGTTTNRLVPTAVDGGLTFASIAAGSAFTCGILTDGTARCWGLNGNGTLGDGTTMLRLTPVAVSGGLIFESITAMFHTCGLAADDVVYCWGRNNEGAVGDGTTTNRLIPTPVSGWSGLP